MLNEINLRDQFAMSAMQGLLASYPTDSPYNPSIKDFAEQSYEVADEMLKVRAIPRD